jgi:hypothetical protein
MVKNRHGEIIEPLMFWLNNSKNDVGEVVSQTIDYLGNEPRKTNKQGDARDMILSLLEKREMNSSELILSLEDGGFARRTAERAIVSAINSDLIEKMASKRGLYRLKNNFFNNPPKESATNPPSKNGTTNRQPPILRSNIGGGGVLGGFDGGNGNFGVNPYTSGKDIIHASDHLIDDLPPLDDSKNKEDM